MLAKLGIYGYDREDDLQAPTERNGGDCLLASFIILFTLELSPFGLQRAEDQLQMHMGLHSLPRFQWQPIELQMLFEPFEKHFDSSNEIRPA